MTLLAPTSSAHHFHPTILREYDIRGIIGDTLHEADAYAIGQTFASITRDASGKANPVIAIGRDGRLSSPALSDALAQGAQAAGAHVVRIGVGPTPMLYFAVYHLQADAGVMITGSHNPPNYNGFKMMLGKASFFGQSIRDLGARAAHGPLYNDEGSSTDIAVFDAYVTALLNASRLTDKPLQLAWDAGNGAAGDVVEQLAGQLAAHGYRSNTLFTTIDGSFPNHHPDPSMPENLRDLQQCVNDNHCQLGLAFDGDGDRLGAVDDLGRAITSDHLLMLFAHQVLRESTHATIIADVKTSQSVFDDISQRGGKAMMWKTGHSHIKTKMKEVGAAFAGEASGHIFFADRYYGFDDGLYAALRLIEIVSALDEPLSAVIDRLPRAHSTPEIRIDCAEERKFTIITELQQKLRDEHIAFNDIDGIRATTPDGWWLLRASNTQAALIARCESATPEGLARLTTQLTQLLSHYQLQIGSNHGH